MRFRNRSGELFFLLLACLAQVVTVLACTLWREGVFVPERWKGPPLTREYLVWYLDEYVPPIDYEGQLFSLYFNHFQFWSTRTRLYQIADSKHNSLLTVNTMDKPKP